jgi:hypothetical protein
VYAAVIFKPETLVRWHRGGFGFFWCWKSRRRAGRPAVPAGIRGLVRQMSRENPLWGAPRIHSELLRLGIDRIVMPSALAGLEVDDQLDFRRLLDRQVGWLLAVENFPDLNADQTVIFRFGAVAH